MSQRGSRRTAHQTMPAHRWAHIYIIVLLALPLTLCTTLTLIAQNSLQSTPTPKTVVVRVDGAERSITTEKATVQDLLHQEGITLNEHDQ